uniref:C1q domain-containing protein n=1 Tax=Esox lucius TaxID=8010 RepID=A0A3P9AM90_ESOLU
MRCVTNLLTVPCQFSPLTSPSMDSLDMRTGETIYENTKTKVAVIPSPLQPKISGISGAYNKGLWRRCFLVAAVCLGLMCLLLMAGIIGLYVTYANADVTWAALEMKVQNLTAKLMVNMDKVSAMERHIAALETRNNVSQVAFSVSLGNPRNYGPFSNNGTMVYKNVFINSGGAYNPGTGVFTAPVRGVYFFIHSGHSLSMGVVGLWLMKNGVQVVSIFNLIRAFSRRYETGSNSVSLALEYPAS